MKFAAAILAFATFFTACSSGAAPTETPEEMVSQAFKNAYNIKSMTYNSTVEGVVKDSAGTSFKEAEFEGTLSGVMNATDPASLKISFKVDGSGKMDDNEKQYVSAEIRMTKEALYAFISKLPDFGEQAPKEMLAMFMNKWWQIPLPEETASQFMLPGVDDANMTPQQKQVKELLEKTNFLKDLKYEGTEKVNGDNTYQYSGKLDTEAVKNFAIEAGKIQGQEPTAEELKQMEEMLQKLNVDVELWIGQEDKLIKKSAGVLTMAPSETGSLEVKFESVIDKINEDVVMEIPEEATLFDPMQFLGVPPPTTTLPGEVQ